MERSTELSLAVLIDADNTSAKWADAIFKEVATLGEASVRRLYGDFSGTGLGGWKQVLARLAIIPHQQFAYTKGKNSSDIALVIEAMDLMHTGRFDGFVLVSSDSDFTRLASRIREQGLQVFGIGRKNTPDAFRNACKRFIFVENLLADAGGLGENEAQLEAEATGDDRPASSSFPGKKTPLAGQDGASSPDQDSTGNSVEIRAQPPSKAVPLIAAVVRNYDEDWVPLSVIGSQVRAAHPDFDARTYGCAKLADLLEKTGQFEVKRNETPVRARMKRMQ